jgi:hypothetical protein
MNNSIENICYRLTDDKELRETYKQLMESTGYKFFSFVVYSGGNNEYKNFTISWLTNISQWGEEYHGWVTPCCRILDNGEFPLSEYRLDGCLGRAVSINLSKKPAQNSDTLFHNETYLLKDISDKFAWNILLRAAYYIYRETDSLYVNIKNIAEAKINSNPNWKVEFAEVVQTELFSFYKEIEQLEMIPLSKNYWKLKLNSEDSNFNFTFEQCKNADKTREILQRKVRIYEECIQELANS